VSSNIKIHERRLHEVLMTWANRQPDVVAVQDAHQALSYSALESESAWMAERFRDFDVRGGDRVLLVGENCVALCVAFLALSKLDAWATVVNARLSEREIDLFIHHSGARRVLYFTNISTEAKAHSERVHASPFVTPVGELSIGPVNQQAAPELVDQDPVGQVAALVYTSGTTGMPKGVMLTHANLLFVAHSAVKVRQLKPGDRIYGVLPMAHVVGLSTQFLGALCGGATLLLSSRFSPEDAFNAFLNEGVTLFTGVPALYARLLEWCRLNAKTITAPKLRLISVAGAPLTPVLKSEVEKAFGLPLQNGFGLTETGPTIAQTSTNSSRKDCAVGAPIECVEVRLVDGSDRNVPMGQTGQLWVRSPGLMKGYYRSPELTAEVINQDGWFNTGDLAFLQEDGSLVISGRSKELIIRSGFNVYPLEVEEVLNTYPGVVQSAVVGREVCDNEEVVAFVELKAGTSLNELEIQAFLRQRLSPYKVPSEIRALESLPCAPSGKVLKHRLKEQAKIDAKSAINSNPINK
jgi:long-chain acyl-CoA synthetase